MFEQNTFENLEEEKLKRIESKYDKREGSVIYDATAASSAEAAQIYISMEWILKQMFGETADREYLMKTAKDTRGIAPKKATYAVLKGVFNLPVPIGSRFNIGGISYKVTELIDEVDHQYRVQCEKPGIEGNKYFGKMVPIGYIGGLTSAELTELLIAGEDEEDTEVFRQRWRDAFQSLSFAGNKAAYKENINNMQGVGGCKVYRAADYDGASKGGHIKCVVISSSFGIPTGELISDIQQAIDPLQDQEGDGLAPLWHIAHIVPVTGTEISVSADITYEAGYNFAGLKSLLEAAIDEYFLELNKLWESASQVVVRVARIESSLLDITGILDIRDTRLNGLDTNIMLDKDAIAVRGEISG